MPNTTAPSRRQRPHDPSSEELIHVIMTQAKRETNRNSFPELAPAEPQAETPRKPAAAPARGAKRSLRARILGYRPSRRPLVLTAVALVAALVVMLRPWLIPAILFVTFWVGLIAYLTLGHDRVVEMLTTAWDRFAARWPGRADALRHRADAFALKFDAFLEKLPKSWAKKLVLRDLSEPADTGPSLDDLPDPFEKLKMPEVYRG